ncbi:Cro/CI family transcriptional regulator [Ralstonia thomasii]
MASETPTSADLITHLGGTGKVAKLLGIRPPSVSEWVKTGIPRPRVSELVIATGRVAKSIDDLSPDRWHLIWPGLADVVRRRIE